VALLANTWEEPRGKQVLVAHPRGEVEMNTRKVRSRREKGREQAKVGRPKAALCGKFQHQQPS
jgi:hypothetical protein